MQIKMSSNSTQKNPHILVKYAHSKQIQQHNENSNHIAYRAQSKKTKTNRSDENHNKNQHAELPLDLSNFEFKLRSGRVTKPLSRLREFELGDWRSKIFFFNFFLFVWVC